MYPHDMWVEPEAQHASRRQPWHLNEPERREGAGAISEAATPSERGAATVPRHALEQMRLVPSPSREPPNERPPPTTALARPPGGP